MKPTPADSLPPHDLDAERAVLNSLLYYGANDTTEFRKLRRLVNSHNRFFSLDHGIMFRCACSLADRGKPVDAVSLHRELIDAGVAEEVGSVAVLADIMQTPIWTSGITHYAALVTKLWQQRQCQAIGRRLIEVMQDNNIDDPSEIIAKAMDSLRQCRAAGEKCDFVTLHKAMERYVATLIEGKVTDIPTGFRVFDDDYHILVPRCYTVLAGRPSMGKSTLAKLILHNVAKRDMSVGLISVEETNEKVAQNFVTIGSGLENKKIFGRNFAPEEMPAIVGSLEAARPLKFWMTDSAYTTEQIVDSIETLVDLHECAVVCVDHLHLITGGETENNERRIAEISQAMKDTAKRSGVALLAVAQLSRVPKGTKPGPPMMSDLRGSGAIEEHADTIALIHRDDYYRTNMMNRDHIVKVNIHKNRNGQTGMVQMIEDLPHLMFMDYDGDPFRGDEYEAV